MNRNAKITMVRNRKLTDMKNIGTKTASRLNEVGIFSEQDLQTVGAVDAHKMIKEKYPRKVIPVGYYLYSFAGALCDKHWNDIGVRKKQALKKSI